MESIYGGQEKASMRRNIRARLEGNEELSH
jgi:hypothetical protein